MCPGETRSLFFGDRRTPELDFQNNRWSPHNQDKYATYDDASTLAGQLAQTKSRGLEWAGDWTNNIHNSGDYTQLHSDVRQMGNLVGVTQVKNGEDYGREWPLNVWPIDVSKTCWQQGSCNPHKGECTCYEGFFGVDCSLRHCPNSTRDLICDAAGSCDHSSGECRCSLNIVTDAGQTVQAYGKDCSYRTCPLVNGYECDREGDCDRKAGLCKCYPGRYGPDCQKRTCPRSQTYLQGYQMRLNDGFKQTTTMGTESAGFYKECDGHGTCDDRTGRCDCQDGFYGDDCSLKYCPQHLGRMCNNEGACNNYVRPKTQTVDAGGVVQDYLLGNCTCNPGFYGLACEFRVCPHALGEGNTVECAGHGACNKNSGMCQCSAGYYGADCRLKTCPEYNGRPCNLNGKCVKTDLMSPEFGDLIGYSYDGDGNELDMGPDGRGRHFSQNNYGVPVKQHFSGSSQGQCVCHHGFYGDACQFRICPVSEDRKLQCDGHGACHKETGYCECQYGYSGADCSIGSCPEWHNRECNNQGECRKQGTIGGSLTAADHANAITYNRDAQLEHSPFDSAMHRDYAVPDTTDNPAASDLGYCVCKPPYYGRSCEKKRCPISKVRQLECDGSGVCDSRVGVCQCNYMWYGKDCSFKRCPENNGRICNLQGDCIKSDSERTDLMSNSGIIKANDGQLTPGQCRCRFPFFGPACQYKRCPMAWASNVHQGDGPRNGLANGPNDEIGNDYLAGLDFQKLSETCSGHGMCDYNNGKCSCFDGYHGDSCHKKECPQVDGRVCNLQGKCLMHDVSTPKQGSCQCNFPWYGESCQYKRCPTSMARPANMPWGMANSEHTHYQVSKDAVSVWGYECDGHGTCNAHTGRCTCHNLYYGESCQYKDCPLVNGRICNNQGTCRKTDQADDNIGTCVCNWPFFGKDCGKKHCPSSGSNQDFSWHGMHRQQECDGHGVCNYDSGRCDCDHGYGGLDCAMKKGLCPMSNRNRQLEYRVCNGEGACNHQTGLCHCFSEEYSGLDCSYRRCPIYPDVNGLECNGHGECIQGFEERGEWTGICQCEDGWSGKSCQEHYASATAASSTAPPSFFAAPHTKPQGAYITSERRHIILGSEGYTEGRLGGEGNAGNQGRQDVQIGVHYNGGKHGSYQSPETWTRSPDYNAGQHPMNVACPKWLTTSDMNGMNGCQHSVTHPETYTGKHTAQPSFYSNYDKVPDGNWRVGDHLSPSHTWHNPDPLSPYVPYSIPQTATPKESVSQAHDHLPGSTAEGIQFMSPSYSGHGGHQYRPKYSKQSNDPGHIT